MTDSRLERRLGRIGGEVIFSLDDDRNGWRGWRIVVVKDEAGAIHVYQEGPQGGVYPTHPMTPIPAESVKSLMKALIDHYMRE